MIRASVQTFDTYVRPRLAQSDIRGEVGRRGKTLEFRPDAVIAAWVDHQCASRPAPKPETKAGEPSAKQRLQNAEAEAAEMKNAERRRHLLPRAEIEPALLQLADALRRAIETIRNNPGADAVEILNDALDDFLAALKRLLVRYDPAGRISDSGRDGADGAADPHAPLAIHATVRGARDHRAVRADAG